MKQLVINIPDNQYRFFIKVLKSFPFVQIDAKKNKLLELEAKLNGPNRKIWQNIKEGITQVELHEKGIIKLNSAKDLLNEL
jgi:ribosomal protein S4E